MKQLSAWLKRLDANDWMYFLGLLLLGVGVAQAVSVATSLSVVGGVLVALSTVRAYFLTWLSFTKKK